MIGGEVAAVGVVSYCFVGENVYAPIGFRVEWCFAFLCALLRSVRFGPTRIALSFPVLASGEISKMTLVPTGGIMLRPTCRGSGKPTQALGKTKTSSSDSVLMKQNFLCSIIVFTIPFLDSPIGLAFTRAYFAFLLESRVSE